MDYRRLLIGALVASKKQFQTAMTTFDENDSSFKPQEGLLSVAGHVAHTAGTVDWFVDGAFGEGWNLDFEGHMQEAHAFASLTEGMEWFERAVDRAIDAVKNASDGELAASIPDKRIMGGSPRAAVVSAIVDHTAHHRGVLAAYARLLGKVPVMPYA